MDFQQQKNKPKDNKKWMKNKTKNIKKEDNPNFSRKN